MREKSSEKLLDDYQNEFEEQDITPYSSVCTKNAKFLKQSWFVGLYI